MPSQLKAAGTVIHGRKSKFKGLILADPPGTGKTLSVLLAIYQDYDPGDGPCVVVVPANHDQHWMDEINKCFKKGMLPAVLLNDESITPFDLFRYRVVIVTYDYLVAERRRMVQFEVDLARYSRGDKDTAPPRPQVALFSDVFKVGGVRAFGKYLILDDAHHLRDYKGVAYKTVKVFRARFEACIAVTGTPLVDSWFDAYALLSMLKAHPITSPALMLANFSEMRLGEDGVQRRMEPEGQRLIRLQAIMDAVTLRRPSPFEAAPETNETIRAILEDITRPDNAESPPPRKIVPL
ncbi:P-loop containing nucleoside triphosphate hydrolase protein [Neohortaea acidophila]|uniref:P-loop containing nucleoside triphosphate hydrolase protein n=1 Tax=Neohortaea acidophila TaxID=245834 RepID=A0A6A6Q3J0_9PEZI|nr:P-loop containing nucleoside triphosphate hydrolase protein [Neohortaea acidophila]KAF2486516.1 P-loop containing nucleoside triphosphate hydrolase protein [Neohortaea acidophila]